MKKGLFSILAGALLVVGCQNYDDQFSNIESQITALASQVAGLSQVQSDLTALAGTVNSLQTSVATTVDTALASGLADIDAAVASLEAATATAATSAEVAAIATAVEANQTDLSELLAASSVFNGPVNITSAATLAAFKAMGSNLAIVNGSVNIATTADMLHADVQTVVNEILTVTGNFTYTSHLSSYAETTFNNLSGVVSLSLKQGGGYKVQTLASATEIILDDTWKSTVTIVDLRGLTSVTTLHNEGATNGSLKFNKATEMHLTKLAYFAGSLDLQVKKGTTSVIDLSAFDDLNAAGTAIVGSTFALSIDGPATQTLTSIGDGTITLVNVATANISGFIGNTVVGAGVENLTVTGAVDISLSAAADLVTVTIAGAKDSDAITLAAMTAAQTAANIGPAITFASSDLTEATISGFTGAITSGVAQTNLEKLTITANTGGKALKVTGNNDLTSLLVLGATIGDVELVNNTDLATVVLDHTTGLATADKGAMLKVTGNTNMTSLTYKANSVDALTVTGNSQLATIDFTGLTGIGTSLSAAVSIKTNALVATSWKDAHDVTAAAGTVQADTGAIIAVASKMKTLATYLGVAMSKGPSVVGVYFDTLELVSVQTTAGGTYAETAAYTDSTTGNTNNAYAYKTAAVANTLAQVKETASFVADLGVNALFATSDLSTGEGIKITFAGVAKDFKQGTSPAISTVASFIAAINADNTWGSGITVTAAQDSYQKSYQTISLVDAAGAGANTGGDTMASVVWKFGTTTGTAAIGSNSTTTQLATAVSAAITGTVEGGYRWNSYSSAGTVVFVAEVTRTGTYQNIGSAITFPSLSFDLDNITSTTVDFSRSLTTTNSTGVNSDFFLSVGNTITKGLRIQVVNNSTTIALTGLTVTDTASTNNNLVILGAGFTALVSGTNMDGNASVDATFAEVNTSSNAVLAVVKNRLTW